MSQYGIIALAVLGVALLGGMIWVIRIASRVADQQLARSAKSAEAVDRVLEQVSSIARRERSAKAGDKLTWYEISRLEGGLCPDCGALVHRQITENPVKINYCTRGKNICGSQFRPTHEPSEAPGVRLTDRIYFKTEEE